jgi:hypothetical protein
MTCINNQSTLSKSSSLRQTNTAVARNPKFDQIEVLDTLQWPDGRTGFYFLRLAYTGASRANF